MSELAKVLNRPVEEAHLLNPAFMSSLAFEFSRSFYNAKRVVVPLSLLPIAGSAVLHAPTRDRLPRKTVTKLSSWMIENQDIRIGFAERTQGLLPYIRAGVRFGLNANALHLQDFSHLAHRGRKGGYPESVLEASTADIRHIVERTRFLGRWFAASGSEATILAIWGVQP